MSDNTQSSKQSSPEKKESSEPGPIETQQQALQILVSALQVAQSRGAFKIEESARIAESIKLFQSKEDQKPLV